MADWENRIVGHGEEDPALLNANPRNARQHSAYQRQVVTEMLDKIGDSRCAARLHRLKTGNGEPATLVTTAKYEDTLRRVDGAWRFASRTVVRD